MCCADVTLSSSFGMCFHVVNARSLVGREREIESCAICVDENGVENDNGNTAGQLSAISSELEVETGFRIWQTSCCGSLYRAFGVLRVAVATGTLVFVVNTQTAERGVEEGEWVGALVVVVETVVWGVS